MRNRSSSKDTRTLDEKLEDMARRGTPNEAAIAKRKLEERRARDKAHPIFRLPGNPYGRDPWERANTVHGTDDPQYMEYDAFQSWMRKQQEDGGWTAAGNPDRARRFRAARQVAPHLYEPRAENGSDILGCKVCGRSKDNPSANHTFGLK